MYKNKVIFSKGDGRNTWKEVAANAPHWMYPSSGEIVGYIEYTCTPWAKTGLRERCTGCGVLSSEKETHRTITKVSGDIPRNVISKIKNYTRATTYGCCSGGDLISEGQPFIRDYEAKG